MISLYLCTYVIYIYRFERNYFHCEIVWYNHYNCIFSMILILMNINKIILTRENQLHNYNYLDESHTISI